MSKDMKLIMESWRKSINEDSWDEQTAGMKFNTLGELRDAIRLATNKKKYGEMTGEGAKFLTDTVAGLLGLGGKKNIVNMAKTVYKLPDDDQIGAGLDFLNVDDMISMIVDDRVENRFLNMYLKQFETEDDSFRLDNLNATKALVNFIKSEYRRVIDKDRGN